jgi:hypothetical protein
MIYISFIKEHLPLEPNVLKIEIIQLLPHNIQVLNHNKAPLNQRINPNSHF